MAKNFSEVFMQDLKIKNTNLESVTSGSNNLKVSLYYSTGLSHTLFHLLRE